MKRIATAVLMAYGALAWAQEERDAERTNITKPLGMKNVLLSTTATLKARDCAALGATIVRMPSCASGLACYNQPRGESATYAVCIQGASQ